jgi:hypothetical protein
MTDKEILEKAIQKAAGYDISVPHFAHPLEKYEWNDEKRYWYLGDIVIPLFEIIYQHDFAKALWDTRTDLEHRITDMYTLKHYALWEWHLMNMVLSNDPIKYLGENI